jgi:hypothetical protein
MWSLLKKDAWNARGKKGGMKARALEIGIGYKKYRRIERSKSYEEFLRMTHCATVMREGRRKNKQIVRREPKQNRLGVFFVMSIFLCSILLLIVVLTRIANE